MRRTQVGHKFLYSIYRIQQCLIMHMSIYFFVKLIAPLRPTIYLIVDGFTSVFVSNDIQVCLVSCGVCFIFIRSMIGSQYVSRNYLIVQEISRLLFMGGLFLSFKEKASVGMLKVSLLFLFSIKP